MSKQWFSRKKNASQAANKAVEPAHTPQMFVEAYEQLCREYGYKLSATPAYEAIGPNAWALVIRMGVAEYQAQEQPEA